MRAAGVPGGDLLVSRQPSLQEDQTTLCSVGIRIVSLACLFLNHAG